MITLQDHTLPGVLSAAGATGYVTGPLAGHLQFRNEIGSRLPVVIASVIATAFLLLLFAFRSPVLAAKAAILNLFSTGAAYGVLVAIFQWGWGSSLLGVSEKVPIESYVPMLMFAIVFGLSMDYEVFLLTRVREAWLATHDNQASVAHGLAATGRVISCAALIMASVFFSFLFSPEVAVKMLAVGLGTSVLIDASVIRLLVVPSAMFLLGTYNWRTPRWLDKLMPGPGLEERAPGLGARLRHQQSGAWQ
jgi:RND superfamily putative drug exporter